MERRLTLSGGGEADGAAGEPAPAVEPLGRAVADSRAAATASRSTGRRPPCAGRASRADRAGRLRPRRLTDAPPWRDRRATPAAPAAEPTASSASACPTRPRSAPAASARASTNGADHLRDGSAASASAPRDALRPTGALTGRPARSTPPRSAASGKKSSPWCGARVRVPPPLSARRPSATSRAMCSC